MESMVGNSSFWKHKRVFITGHTGFKGSWLAMMLHRYGALITGYALEPMTVSLYDSANVGTIVTSCFGDIRDITTLRKALERSQPEIVFHLAAQPLVRYSYSNPVETYETNVIGTVTLLECIRSVSSIKAVVVVTSDKCYDNKEWIWPYRETDAMGGHDPYSSSKGCAELVVEAYRRSFFIGQGIHMASARAGNVIGGGDWAADRLVPDIMKSFARNERVKIRFPNAIRPWQHVFDALTGYMILAERLCGHDADSYSRGWNFGPSHEDSRSVIWIVKKIADIWGNDVGWEFADNSEAHESHKLTLDSSLARNFLQWLPRLSLDSALKWTIEWYRTFYENPTAVSRFSEEQIIQYEDVLRS